MSYDEILTKAQESAASLFEDRDYLTSYGQMDGDKDPWDDDAVDISGWVPKIVDAFFNELPKPAVTFEAVTEPEKLPRISKSLNLGRGYAEHWERYSCRELVQNWFDACVEQCGGDRYGMEVVTTKAPALGLARGAEGIVYLCLYKGTFAGYLADFDDNDGARSVELVNYGGMITVDAMVLGNSSKRGQSGATGFFGEGVKVEINRLTASGMDVTYTTPVDGATTHHSAWQFSYEAEAGGASSVLHLHMESQQGPATGVAVLVKGLPRGRAAIDPKSFLFLQGGYTRVTAPPTSGAAVAGIDVLLDPQHEGRIYVGGIFALPWATLKGVGLDYTGSGDSFKHVGLGRDRTSVHVHELIHLLPSALAHQKGTPEATALLQRIYDTLDQHPHSEMAWIRDIPFEGELTAQAREWWFAFADSLVDLFTAKHGALAMPCESHEMSTMHEAEGMGATAVTVSFPLKTTLTGSTKCPSMDRYRSDFYDSMLGIKDVELDLRDPQDKRVSTIRDAVVHFFSEVKVEQTHFKRPPKGNQRLVVPVGELFIVDFNLFQLDAVHRAQAAAGGNICMKRDCGCQSLALVKGFTDAIAGKDDHRRMVLEQRVMRALLEQQSSGPSPSGGGSGNNKKEATAGGGSDDDKSDDGGGGDNGGGSDMLAMLMGSAAESDDEGGGSEDDAAIVVNGVVAGAAFPPAPFAGPSRPPPPKHDIGDIRSKLSLGAKARFQALTKRIARASETVACAGMPPDLVCPLTAELFLSPVVATDGHTYEKDAIEIWLMEHSESPITDEPIGKKDTLRINNTLKSLIEDLKTGNAALPSGGGGGNGGRGSGGPSFAPKPSPRRPPKGDLDSIYMTREPANRRPTPEPKGAAAPRPPQRDDDSGSDDNEPDEEAFKAMMGKGGGGKGGGKGTRPAPSRLAASKDGDEGKAAEPAQRKKSWIFGKKK